jgi:hypothetical protein
MATPTDLKKAEVDALFQDESGVRYDAPTTAFF